MCPLVNVWRMHPLARWSLRGGYLTASTKPRPSPCQWPAPSTTIWFGAPAFSTSKPVGSLGGNTAPREIESAASLQAINNGPADVLGRLGEFGGCRLSNALENLWRTPNGQRCRMADRFSHVCFPFCMKKSPGEIARSLGGFCLTQATKKPLRGRSIQSRPLSSSKVARCRNISAPLRRRGDLQLRELPENIQEFVERARISHRPQPVCGLFDSQFEGRTPISPVCVV
jgi:hypothetical protein